MLKAGGVAPQIDMQPVFGLRVNLQKWVEKRAAVIIFVRGLNDPFCRQAMASIQEEYPKFDLAGIQVLVVTRSNLETARDFVPRYHVLAPVIADSEGALFEAFGVSSAGMKQTLKALVGDITKMNEGFKFGVGLPEGVSKQFPAEFVIGKDLNVVYANLGDRFSHQPDLAKLLEVASTC